jgi:glycine cleavage system H protein
MADDLTFLMGKFPARLPADLRYARNHMWCRDTDGGLRFGFTAYAVRLMKDVYFLDWCVDDGAAVALKQQIGNIETSKAVSDLFAPIAGTLLRFNRELLKDPSAINVDSYGPGWLFEMAGDGADLMGAADYYQFLESGWEATQRLLKGQVNKGDDD